MIQGDLPLHFHPAATRASAVCVSHRAQVEQPGRREALIERSFGADCGEGCGDQRWGLVSERGMRSRSIEVLPPFGGGATAWSRPKNMLSFRSSPRRNASYPTRHLMLTGSDTGSRRVASRPSFPQRHPTLNPIRST